MNKKELQLRRLYEKPICEVSPFEVSVGILAGSPQPEAGITVTPWEETEPENPGGTSEETDDLPDWLKP